MTTFRFLKKIGVMVVLLSLMLSYMSVNASSDFPNSNQTGNITIHKFNAKDYDNLSQSSGTKLDETQLPDNVEKVEGITFTLEKMEGTNGGEVSVDSEVDDTFSKITGVTNSEGEIVFPDLSKGYYKVTEMLSDDYTAQKQSFIVMLPMKQNIDGEITWNYDVHVYPKDIKNETGSDIKKEMTSQDNVVGIGSEVDWTIYYTVSSDIKEVVTNSNGDETTIYAKDYYITDTMDSRLDYVDKSAIFTAYDSADNIIDISLKEGEDYIESFDEEKNQVIWTYTDSGVKKMADSGVAKVGINLKTTINETAEDSVKHVWNNASIDYTNATGDPYHKDVFDPDDETDSENVPKVYMGSITIDKYDSEDEAKKLEGAVFHIADSEENVRKGVYLTRTIDGDEKEIEATTDSNGQAMIIGLLHGDYYLVESKAPEGYQNTDNIFKVSIGNDTDTCNVRVSISNTKIKTNNPSFPNTGDNNMIIPFIALLLVSSIYILFRYIRHTKTRVIK